MPIKRRHWLVNLLGWSTGIGQAFGQTQKSAQEFICSPMPGPSFLPSCTLWPKGIEGQRKADLGNGFFINPILSGDHPDPTILKDGNNYYMTHSSFEACPGLLIWHSKDLLNWQPLTHALNQYIGSVWAPELCKYQNRYFLYIPAKKTAATLYPNDIWVIYADRIEGPWSEPVRLGNGRIDPGHAVGEDGQRYLFLSGGLQVPLSSDGLSITGHETHVYEGWTYPSEWDVEAYSQEGPKILNFDGWYHMVLAVGGTAGPPTSHMVICARSRSIHGPWTNHPHNPVIKTRHAGERWWSKGHGTLVQGPNEKDWYLLYHGYEAGFHTLGRQTLMMPMRYTDDGWFEASHDSESDPLPAPQGGRKLPHGMPLSDSLEGPQLGPQWSFYRGGAPELRRIKFENRKLHLQAVGTSPQNSSPLCIVALDPAYEVEVELSFDEGVQAGLILFYSDKLYAGVGYNERNMMLHRYGMDQRTLPKPNGMNRSLRIRLSNRWHVLTIHTSQDEGQHWEKFPIQMDVSGYHHNVAYGFMSLRPALYASGSGKAVFSNFKYRAIERLARAE